MPSRLEENPVSGAEQNSIPNTEEDGATQAGERVRSNEEESMSI